MLVVGFAAVAVTGAIAMARAQPVDEVEADAGPGPDAGSAPAPDAGPAPAPAPGSAADPAPAPDPEPGAAPAPESGGDSAPAPGSEGAPAPAPEPGSEPAPESAPDADIASGAETGDEPVEIDSVTVFGGQGGRAKEPGSAHTIDEEELERFEHNDIHRVLGSVPGVYVRQEEGYGLRPNIGMRGAAAERSAKIALLEDGVPIAPAPYSAPAAYYMPLVTRMERVEVLKGPVAIQEGPNTVGGAVNLISKRIPYERTIMVDAAGGGDLYGKLHASYGESTDHFGWLVEGVKLRSNGFKELDGGGNTGFDKNDARVVLRANTEPDRRIYHEVSLELGYSDEVSNETYTGLSDGDFEATPYRRYAATQRDEMRWDHRQAELGYHVDLGGSLAVDATLYRNEFDRAWDKLNGFDSGDSLGEILANPESGNNAIYYGILTGREETFSERLVLGRNDRSFVSQGVQSTARLTGRALGVGHELTAGARLHADRVHRYHTEATYLMMDGEMQRDEADRRVTRDATGSARALALYLQEQASIGPATVTAGVRTELVGTSWRDHANPDNDSDASYSAIIPGAGVFYEVLPSLGVLAGVHRGFLPVAPGQPSDVSPEESVNYELGARLSKAPFTGEVIGFHSDYSNLKGTCSFSQGCDSDQEGAEFDGGAVNIYGVEALSAAELDVASWLRVPVTLSYTFTRSKFRTSFSSDNPQWGEVDVGDELPYLPRHQLALEVGARGSAWEVSLAGRYVSRMRDSAGQGDEGRFTDRSMVVDAAASYAFGRWGSVYATVDNVLDDTSVVSYRPYGARPGKPRLVVVGYKNEL